MADWVVAAEALGSANSLLTSCQNLTQVVRIHTLMPRLRVTVTDVVI